MAKKQKCTQVQYKERDGEVVAFARYPIQVTMDDIVEGEIQDGSSCAIARAVKRATGCDYASVGGAAIEVGDFRRPEGVEKKLDRALNKFVNRFDSLVEPDLMSEEDPIEFRKKQIAKKKLKPFSFVLEVEQVVGDAVAPC